ncbi:hypothetical protein K443DRAFT_15365 [Laccaria amethystina LaAM-08-1]|uniref:Uncharacterized protein n=1 Tax=Laccaria amethystina LaAM-08-1 TaxID=1095629 RepID=A0A0C9WR32_9AGAR|nr:hypothetical protein K443DRAFT_15365 [Laccaria amethystina LaAM-08-1]
MTNAHDAGTLQIGTTTPSSPPRPPRTRPTYLNKNPDHDPAPERQVPPVNEYPPFNANDAPIQRAHKRPAPPANEHPQYNTNAAHPSLTTRRPHTMCNAHYEPHHPSKQQPEPQTDDPAATNDDHRL